MGKIICCFVSVYNTRFLIFKQNDDPFDKTLMISYAVKGTLWPTKLKAFPMSTVSKKPFTLTLSVTP